VLVLDGAGWHTSPALAAPYASGEGRGR